MGASEQVRTSPGRRARIVARAFVVLASTLALALSELAPSSAPSPVASERLVAAPPVGATSAETSDVSAEAPRVAAAARIAIPRIGVDASLVDIGITPDGYMDSPASASTVGWYQHGARPGEGGNAVFTGHVDFIHVGPAVFWNLARLEASDLLAISLEDGSSIRYRVVSVATYSLPALDMEAVLAPTPVETVTLITCGGVFSGTDYSHRVVVRATRIG